MKGSAMFRRGLVAFALLTALGIGNVLAADELSDDVKRLGRDAGRLGRSAAAKGKDIAERAADFAERVADDVSDAYKDAVKE